MILLEHTVHWCLSLLKGLKGELSCQAWTLKIYKNKQKTREKTYITEILRKTFCVRFGFSWWYDSWSQPSGIWCFAFWYMDTVVSDMELSSEISEIPSVWPHGFATHMTIALQIFHARVNFYNKQFFSENFKPRCVFKDSFHRPLCLLLEV